MKKVLMVASSGGHMEELTRLKEVISRYDCCWVTEKNDFQNYGDNIKIDYCKTRYTVDGKSYSLEFMFRPDGYKGLVCMLYLYFPREGSTNHIEEAAYTAGTLDIR